jgi:hydroxyacylglutathione hydrolase
LLQKYPVEVYTPKNETIAGSTRQLKQGDNVIINSFDLKFKVFDIPAHTLGHIAYYDGKHLFCGDTLFAAGCGRLFEGTAAQMVESLAKLSCLPADTLVYCAHEYTQSNLQFALTVEPDNQAIRQRLEQVRQNRILCKPTLPSTIGLELETNPFLRCQKAAVIESAQRYAERSLSSEVEVFATLRAWKDCF